jgi:hypothetical protein
MCELTESEIELLEEVGKELENEITLHRVVVADYVISELRNQFGEDVIDFVIGHQSASMQFNTGFILGDIPVLTRAGDLASCGYGEFSSELTNKILSIQEERASISLFSKEAKELAKSIDNLFESKKVTWLENYNKAVNNGDINSKAD